MRRKLPAQCAHVGAQIDVPDLGRHRQQAICPPEFLDAMHAAPAIRGGDISVGEVGGLVPQRVLPPFVNAIGLEVVAIEHLAEIDDGIAIGGGVYRGNRVSIKPTSATSSPLRTICFAISQAIRPPNE